MKSLSIYGTDAWMVYSKIIGFEHMDIAGGVFI